MSENVPYSADVAGIYDLLVEGQEDAEAGGQELEFIRRALRDVCPREVRDVLDVGCGTGRHLIPLVRDGCRVVGVDVSEGMIAECRRKLERRGLQAKLRVAGLLELDCRAAYDAVLAMNSVVCYLVETERIREGLRRLHDALRPGGLLLLDNCNLLGQWVTFDQTHWDKRTGPTMRVEFEERRRFEDFTAVLRLEVKASVEENGRRFEIHNEDVLRVMTVGELTCYLRDAGFADVRAYPAFDFDTADERSGDRMIFLALRPR